MSKKSLELMVVLTCSAITVYLCFSFVAASFDTVSGWDGFGRCLAVIFWLALSLLIMGYRRWFE